MLIESSQINMGTQYQKKSEEVVVSNVQKVGTAAMGMEGTALASEVSVGSYSASEMAFYKEVTSAVLGELRTVTDTQYKQTKTATNAYEKSTDAEALGKIFDSAETTQEGPNVNRIQQVFAHAEEEMLNYSVEGSVKTSDGAEISINISLGLSRELVSKEKRDEILVDPLVINYDAPSVALSSKQFAFDIDADGVSDQISLLRQGSGYLALDKNGDGRINDGSELFGTDGTDGFSALALFDDDKNGWIDANDPIFNKLRIWVKDDQGNDTLLGLGQTGIGAILLSKTDTPFDLMDDQGQAAGALTHSSIFLKENGDVGLVQNIMQTVHAKPEQSTEADTSTADQTQEAATEVRSSAPSQHSFFDSVGTQGNSDVIDSANAQQEKIDKIQSAHRLKIRSLDSEIGQLKNQLTHQQDEKEQTDIKRRMSFLVAQKANEESRMLVELSQLRMMV